MQQPRRRRTEEARRISLGWSRDRSPAAARRPRPHQDESACPGESESSVDDAVAADTARRAAIAAFEELRAEQNAFGKTVAKAPKDEKKALVAQAQELAGRVKAAQAESTEADAAFDRAIRAIGNPIIDGVPAGGEENFVTLREVGTRRSFDFEPLDHADLGESSGRSTSSAARRCRGLASTSFGASAPDSSSA